MIISLNGERTETRGAKTVADLVDRFALPASSILIERNRIALHRHEWPGEILAEDDRIEFIRVAAGG